MARAVKKFSLGLWWDDTQNSEVDSNCIEGYGSQHQFIMVKCLAFSRVELSHVGGEAMPAVIRRYPLIRS